LCRSVTPDHLPVKAWGCWTLAVTTKVTLAILPKQNHGLNPEPTSHPLPPDPEPTDTIGNPSRNRSNRWLVTTNPGTRTGTKRTAILPLGLPGWFFGPVVRGRNLGQIWVLGQRDLGPAKNGASPKEKLKQPHWRKTFFGPPNKRPETLSEQKWVTKLFRRPKEPGGRTYDFV